MCNKSFAQKVNKIFCHLTLTMEAFVVKNVTWISVDGIQTFLVHINEDI